MGGPPCGKFVGDSVVSGIPWYFYTSDALKEPP